MDLYLNEIPNSQLHKQSKYYRSNSKLNIMTNSKPTQIQQRYHQSRMQNKPKVNNKDRRAQ